MTRQKTIKAPKKARPKLVDHDKGVIAIIARQRVSDTQSNRIKAENVLAKQRLQAIQEEIEDVAAEVVYDALQGVSLDPEQREALPEDILAKGEKIAQAKFRRMQAGLLPAKDAPIGLKIAMNIHIQGMRSRTEEKKVPLNVQVAVLNQQPTEFPVKRVEK